MADTKISDLPEKTDPAGNDWVPIVDVDGGTITKKSLLRNTGVAGGGRYLIGEVTPTDTGTVTWSSIPATYKSLEIDFVARSTKASVVFESMYIYLNNDTTGTNYRRTTHTTHTTFEGPEVGEDSDLTCPAANATANTCGAGMIHILQYAGTTFNKQVLAHMGWRYDTSSVHVVEKLTAIEWESTAAVNRVDLVLAAGNYVSGSTFRLYGTL